MVGESNLCRRPRRGDASGCLCPAQVGLSEGAGLQVRCQVSAATSCFDQPSCQFLQSNSWCHKRAQDNTHVFLKKKSVFKHDFMVIYDFSRCGN